MSYLEELLPELRKGAKIRMKSWPENEYIYRKGNDVLNERGKTFNFTNYELFSNWELYQETINWQYIIDHECLCWFWDYDNQKKLGILGDIRDGVFQYLLLGGDYFMNCHPARRDEVNFYEDKKDE